MWRRSPAATGARPCCKSVRTSIATTRSFATCSSITSLHPASTHRARPVVRIVAQWSDSTLFWAAMGYSAQPGGRGIHVQGPSARRSQDIAEDRAKWRAGAGRMSPGDATSAYKSYLRRIASMVDNQPFVMGQQPSLADFSCYHALGSPGASRRWPVFSMPRPASLRGWACVAALRAWQNGRSDAAAAIAVARNPTPASVEKRVPGRSRQLTWAATDRS